jgi:hypothetical protein
MNFWLINGNFRIRIPKCTFQKVGSLPRVRREGLGVFVYNKSEVMDQNLNFLRYI